MTTEVVVISRIGVALATDSAITITDGKLGTSKVFVTGDKLFELNCDKPIGIMINGNMDFLGVPWELIIKDFRGLKLKMTSIKDALEKFLDYAAAHDTMDGEAEAAYIVGRATEELSDIRETVQAQVLKLQKDGDEDGDADVVAMVEQEVRSRTAYLESLEPCESLAGLTSETLLQRHQGTLDAAIDGQKEWIVPSDEMRGLLRRLLAVSLLSSHRSSYTTGLVVAGFAGDGMFPAMARADVDGAVCGRIRYVHEEELTIDRKRSGRVFSFAQTDVADRLLYGVDNEFIEKSADHVRQSLQGLEVPLTKLFEQASMSIEEARAIYYNLIKTIDEEYREKFAEKAKEEFHNNFDRMVAMMPKQDIIELAEALVSITAIERKASSEQETVGGPVDVAFITRHEGFVWIKRKQYFQASLNPRYFSRKFGWPKPKGGAE